MKTRIISGTVFAVIGLAIILLNNSIVDSVFVTVLAVMACFEFYRGFKQKGVNCIQWIGYASCLGIMLVDNHVPEEYKYLIYKMAISIGAVSIFAYMVISKLNRNITDIAVTVMSIIYIPTLFSFLKRVLMMEDGRILIWYVVLGAFASDTFAYFIGCRFGKHKLCPTVSPNKSVEGAIGGVFGVVVSYAILTVVANTYFNFNMDIVYWILIAIVASIVGQMGDLTESAIKRYIGIKDFGKLMPGHGGILDRFDSIMFVAPIVYIFIKLYV